MERKSVREVIENPRNDEYYILTTRYYPMELRKRAMKFDDSPFDEWNRSLAPPKELLDDWKDDRISWGEYEKRFRKEIDLSDLLNLNEEIEKKIVLSCIEEDNEYPHCHTWILLEMINEAIEE